MPVENLIQDLNSTEALMAMANLPPDTASLHIINQVREMSSSPSPLAIMLSDPEIVETKIMKRHRKKHRDKSSSPRRDRKYMDSLLYDLVGEEERQALHLKSALVVISGRLQHEVSQTNQANERAGYAESRAREFCSRAAIAESSLATAERELAILKSDIEDYHAQLKLAREEARLAKAHAARLESERVEADASVTHARDIAREYAEILREYQEKEIVVEEEQRVTLQRWFDEGREQGWRDGHGAGYEKGRQRGLKEGRREGLREGRERGRKEERQSALLAFDDFLVAQTYGPNDKLTEMVRRWRESVYPTGRPDTRAPTPISQPSNWRDETDSSSSVD